MFFPNRKIRKPFPAWTVGRETPRLFSRASAWAHTVFTAGRSGRMSRRAPRHISTNQARRPYIPDTVKIGELAWPTNCPTPGLSICPLIMQVLIDLSCLLSFSPLSFFFLPNFPFLFSFLFVYGEKRENGNTYIVILPVQSRSPLYNRQHSCFCSAGRFLVFPCIFFLKKQWDLWLAGLPFWWVINTTHFTVGLKTLKEKRKRNGSKSPALTKGTAFWSLCFTN